MMAKTTWALPIVAAFVLATSSGPQSPAAAISMPAQQSPRCLGKVATIVGTDRNDVIRGTDRRDVIVGFGGNDTIDGLDGADTICGGAGNDAVTAGHREGEDEGPDVLSGDGGDDVLKAGEYAAVVSFEEAPGPVVASLATHRASGWGDDRLVSRFQRVIGSAYGDTLTGTDEIEAGGESLSGGAGNDRLFGMDGGDLLDGGAGDDTLDGGRNTDPQGPEEAIDFVSYTAAPRRIVADLASGRVTGWGNDRLTGIEGVEGSRYADRMVGGPQSHLFYGLDGNDVLRGGAAIDSLQGGNGNDLLVGGDGQDSLLGDAAPGGRQGIGVTRPGNDRLRGGRGDDELRADGGRDWLQGGPGSDRLTGGEGRQFGNDRLDGGPGNDWAVYEFAPRNIVVRLGSGRVSGRDRFSSIENLIGSRYADRLFGNPGRNEIYGRGEADFIVGASGNDALFGEDGNDRIGGGPGRDALDGGPGRDWVDGGSGRDRCTTGERRHNCP